MINRIAIFTASLAAALTLAFALAVGGLAPGAGRTAQPSPTTGATDVALADAVVAPGPVQVDTVYVAAPPPQATITVHKTVAASAGESDEGSEGND